MATTLVIKNASFSANKVDTVEFIENIPCTGISVSPSSFAFTYDGETKEIEYTLTPSDTTDTVNIVSSNTDIVQISGDNAVAVGVGTATITITCGNQTATISVTSEMTMERYFKPGYYAQKYVTGGGTERDYATDSPASNFGYAGSEDAWGDGRYIAVSSEPYIHVYKIPGNCGSIDIKVPTGWKSIVLFFDNSQAGMSGSAKLISGETISGAVEGDRTVSVPSGANAFGITYRTTKNTFSSSDLTGYDVEFLPVSAT